MGCAFMSIKERLGNAAWWCIPAKPTQGRLEQEDPPGLHSNSVNITHTKPTLTNRLVRIGELYMKTS